MKRSRVTCCVMILGILCVTAAAQEAKSTHEPDHLLKDAGPQANDEARTLLQRALHLADLYNWQASRPYFSRAQQLFETTGDKRNPLYAHLGAIRAGADPAPITEQSYRLAQELATNPMLQSDKELRMFCLIVKGDFDGEIDVPAMRRDWSEVAALARELGNSKWQYRAQGQLGFADFYDGDLAAAQRSVGAALIAALNAHDVGAQIFYLSATANGLESQQMNDQAITYAERAIAISEANPDAGYPLVAQRARLLAMVQAGRIDGAQTELNTLLARAEAQNDRYQLADLNSTASQIARAKNDLPKAIAYLNEALRQEEAGYGSATPQLQSDLSDLYRLSRSLSKAEELARKAAESAQAEGYIARIPAALHRLAQVQISQHKYAEADRTYDRAAMIQDMMIGNTESTLGKTALIKAASDLYAKHFALVAEHIGDTEKAFAIIEQVRGRGTRPELPDHRQRFDASHESPESVVSQLGDSLCGPGRLLYPPSHRVAGKDPGSRRPPARRATLPATRHAATLAPTSAARTASRESEASHHRQATEDSIARAHSLGLSGGSDPDPASFSHQAPAVGLQWTGVGNPRQRGIPLRPRPTAAPQKAGLHPGVEQGLQPRSERPVQSRRYQGQCTARTISGFLPEITGQRHQADDGASHPGAQDCSHYADSVEEGRKLRR